MKIAQIAPIWNHVPPTGYGGTELIVSLLTEELVSRGHTVDLYATAQSKTKAHLKSATSQSLVELKIPWTEITYPILHIAQALDHSSEYDIVHLHITSKLDYIALLLARSLKNVLFTCHVPLPQNNATTNQPGRLAVLTNYNHIPLVSISNNQRNNLPLNFIRTVYNAIRIEDYTLSTQPSDYFFWISRIGRDKGAKESIEAVRESKSPLVMAGKVDMQREESRTYFEKFIKPSVDDGAVRFVGELTLQPKIEYYQKARALLFPICWEEPFGLVMIEAMACGTPVIAFARGSVPEVVIDGVTGFIINSSPDDIRGDWIIKKTGVPGIVEAMNRIGQIDRSACRKHVEEHFTVKKMVDGYEDAYKQLLSGN